MYAGSLCIMCPANQLLFNFMENVSPCPPAKGRIVVDEAPSHGYVACVVYKICGHYTVHIKYFHSLHFSAHLQLKSDCNVHIYDSRFDLKIQIPHMLCLQQTYV